METASDNWATAQCAAHFNVVTLGQHDPRDTPKKAPKHAFFTL
jgi:hypothetical protein